MRSTNASVVNKPTVNDVANDVALGCVDTGFVWDATVRQTDTLETVPAKAIEKIAATFARLRGSQIGAAGGVAPFRYLASCGQRCCEKHGFEQ